jgi:hypothetical protein
MNSKIMRVKVNSASGERFALMKVGFASNSKAKYTWAIRINKLFGWIGLGASLKGVISKALLKFNYTTPGHGSYLISGNGYSWSHSQNENNSKNQVFNFGTGDTIIMQFNPAEGKISFKKHNSTNPAFVLKTS